MDTSVSRRSFFRMAAAASALAALPLSEPEMAHAAIQKSIPGWDTGYPANAVRIDSNENPLGPCQAACDSMTHRLHQDGRYDFYLTDKVAETFAAMEGLKTENVSVYAGSTVPLHHAVLAFTSKDRSYVTADPSYETGMNIAALNGVKVIKVKLAADYSHDTRAMVAADPNAGLFYICNPNNPTGTLTSREQIEYAVAHKPTGSILLIDEAYIHFSEAASPSIDLVKAGKDVIVLRTFSKIYGMAGLRCGMAIARPDLLERLTHYGVNFNPMPATSSAVLSLKDKTLVPQRRKINTEIREATFDWLHKNHFQFIPSESNCFLLHAGRPGHEVMAAMAKHNVFIGRVWPIMPDWVRITVGSHQDMARFQSAWKNVMESSTAAFTLPAGMRFRSELPPLALTNPASLRRG